jgi:hypothetical protein
MLIKFISSLKSRRYYYGLQKEKRKEKIRSINMAKIEKIVEEELQSTFNEDELEEEEVTEDVQG